MTPTFHRSLTTELDVPTLYRVLRLRVQVFVVEQDCPYQDLDGRDLEPGTELLWAQEGTDVLATVRLLRDPTALRIGRVATAPDARGRGLAASLLDRALERCAAIDPGLPVVLDAQAHLEHWYARFGFAVDGPGFDEDGIAHVPMRRPAPGAAVQD